MANVVCHTGATLTEVTHEAGAGGGRQGACRSEGGVQCVRLRGKLGEGRGRLGRGLRGGVIKVREREGAGWRGEVGATVLFVQLFRSC